jgi:very-short-patch-repair endonuclease
MPFRFVCDGCGQTFERHTQTIPDRCAKRYCSRKCANAAKIKKRAPCKRCGVTVAPEGLYWAAHRAYCSRACYGADRANRVEKVCGGCKSTFTITKGATAHRYNFCTLECKRAHSETIVKPCKRCGKPFRHSGGDIKRGLNRHYCSEECRRPPVHIQCAQCDKQFRIVPADAKRRRFCSLACYRKFSGETSIETKVRQSLERLRLPFIQELQVGRYVVDFALNGIALEVDGTYWHRKPSDRREQFLERAGWPLIRIAEAEIRKTTDLDALIADKLKHVPHDQLTRRNEALPLTPDGVIRRAYKRRSVLSAPVPKPPCSVADCGRPQHAKTFCKFHYCRFWRQGDTEARPRRKRPLCSISDCGRPHASRGFCKMHLKRWRRHGDPIKRLRNRRYQKKPTAIPASPSLLDLLEDSPR